MNVRKHELGSKNMIGKRITALRSKRDMTENMLMAKLQVEGVDICYTSLSKLEGQFRYAHDMEVAALCRIFNVTAEYLIGTVENSE